MYIAGADFRNRTIRAPINPLDKCTVISILPKEIDETKPTIQPGRFIIPPGSLEKPSLLVVGPSSWWKKVDDDSPLIEIPTGSIQIANSIIRDYCNGLLACDMGGSMPGIFFVPGMLGTNKNGEFDLTLGRLELNQKYKTELDVAHKKQRMWYSTLITMADTLWVESKGNPIAISSDMRLAAHELGQNTKEWLQDFQATETIRCTACGSLRNPLYPICPTCHTVIDKKKYDEMNLVQAK